jgi:hypothetical protein
MHTNVKPLIALACSFSLVCGCVQGPDYVKPEVEVPPAYRFQMPAQELQQPAWWNAYADPYLDALVKGLRPTTAIEGGQRGSTVRRHPCRHPVAGIPTDWVRP